MMNVFEDLVVELQAENLLESTVIDGEQWQNGHASTEKSESQIEDMIEPASPRHAETTVEINQKMTDFPLEDDPCQNNEPNKLSAEVWEDKPVPMRLKQKNSSEFFKKRAVDEVASLQMVEHILTGVEREYQKIVPKSFDDFNAKRALHSFLQVAEEINSEEHAKAEFALLHETESWCTALSERDRNIPVSSVRQYIENSSPTLSSQAMLAIARFYRNLPYSENVRGKFDFVITRLFSRPAPREMRQMLFDREQMLGHVKTLYADWSSVSLYSADESDDSNVMLTALSFEELCQEAESTACFDQLLENDFFVRLRLFKESVAELFYAPEVTIAAIECNVRVGNAYVNLIDRERAKMDEQSIQAKYSEINDLEVSNAASRTLDLVDILRAKANNHNPGIEMPDEQESAIAGEEMSPQPLVNGRNVQPIQEVSATTKSRNWPPFVERMIDNARNINRWFLASVLVLIAGSVGVYIWANFVIADPVATAGVRKVEIEGTIFKDHIKTVRISGDTFYGLLASSWDLLPKEKRLEYLQKVYAAAREQSCTQVDLIGKDGKSAAYASPTRIEVVMP